MCDSERRKVTHISSKSKEHFMENNFVKLKYNCLGLQNFIYPLKIRKKKFK